VSARACRWTALAAGLSLTALLGPAGPASGQVADIPDAPRLGALFSDHAVLQRDRPVPVWGTGAPGRPLTVTFGPHRLAATAGPDGVWRVRLPASPAGGPYRLSVSDAAGHGDTAENVLVGDVWLCSGQSNMELPVNRTLNAPSVIGASADDGVRLLTVAKDFDPAPQAVLRRPVSWAPAGPATVGDFSAACYHFARDLRRDHDVPMGLIHASWGGSNIETWMSAGALEAAGEGDRLAVLARLATDPAGAQAAWGRQWEGWWRDRAPDAPWSPDDAGPWTPVPAMVPWERWGVPALAAYNGMVWYRLDLELTAAQAAAAVALSLGPIDEADQTWVNGVAVGASGSGDRLYALPRGALRAGRNTLVVNVHDSWEVGGLYGPPEGRALVLADGTRLPLDPAGWRYRTASVAEGPPRAPWSSTSGLTTIGNAMIAPLQPYGLRGVLWYQGESNTGAARRYRDLLTGLMADWRRGFAAPDLPFLVVQLANFGPPATAPGPSGWAELRESQRRAVAADPHAALAVAIDLGDAWDIHPAQKQELGRRLARAARRLVYGDPAPPSGPRPLSVRRDADAIHIRFGDVVGRLVTRGGDSVLGMELCAAEERCRYATAVVEGDTVRIAAPPGEPVASVRYCWADNPLCNLQDESGLPAGPFRELSGDPDPPV
jgi:sialate O-acetylesterase